MQRRSEFFAEYFESVFVNSNTLDKAEFEKRAEEFDLQFGMFLPENKNAKILDIGSGAGHFLYYLAQKGYSDFMGIDISPDQIGFCKKNISKHVLLVDAFEFLDGTVDSYDIIAASDVIEHIPKEKVIDFLVLVKNRLTSQGAILLMTPNMSNPFSQDSRYRDFTHECGFTEKSIYQVLYMAGYRDISIYPAKFAANEIKGFLCKIFVSFFHFLIRKMFWYQALTAPNILSSRLIAVARK